MKSSEMHEGLPQKETRNFLSMQMVLAYEAEKDNQKKITNHKDFTDTFEWAKADAREHIIFLEKYIKNVETKQAILVLIEKAGWEEFDVSDDVYNDCGYRNHMNFIGTKEEYDTFYTEYFGV